MSEGLSLQKLTPKIHLEPQDWEAFKAHVNTHYPRPSFTHEQKEFVKKALLQDHGQCTDLNRYWVSFFVQSLLENADETWHLDAKSLNEQIDKLKNICARGMLGFYEIQHAIRLEIPYQDRNAFQERMLEIHPNIVNFPIELCVDIGTILNIQKFQGASNLKTPGESNTDASLLFQQVHNKLQQMTEPGKGKLERQVTGETSGSDEAEAEWSPHGTDNTYMRLCTYKTWADKYESELEWSPNKMVNEWLKEAIQLYSHVSYHWSNCKVKHFSDKQFPAIQTTAINSWLADVANRAATTKKVSKPSGNWIFDWHSTPLYDKRHEWEQYYCTVILNAKNIAKLLHKEEKLHSRGEAVPMEEEGQVPEGPSTKKAKTEGEGQPATDTPLSIIVREFHKLERRIEHLEKHENERHQEILRELTGHFHPIRVHLLHLNQGQHHLQATVDRLRK